MELASESSRSFEPMTIEKLLSIASAATLPNGTLTEQGWGDSFQELTQMLSAKNGFYAFEGALHVLPWIASDSQPNVLGIQAWNQRNLWRDWYQGLTDGLF